MQTIYLDISNKGVVPTIYAKQNDVGRKFEVVLTDSGVPHIPASGSAFSVWYSGTSGEGNYTDIGDKSAFSVNGNKVIVEMITQMLSNDGEGILSLVLNDIAGNQIGLWSIRYVCESVPGANSEDAKEYYTAFSESVKELSYTEAILQSKLSVDGSITMEADLPMGWHKVTGLGEPATDGDAVNLGYARKIGNPYNLLDNSDFRNPVNQRGQTSYLGNTYSIDRWNVNSSTTLTVMDDFCRLSGYYNLWQIVPVTLKAGKTYTCAARIKASEGIRDGWLLVEGSVDGTRLGGWSKKISDWTIAIVNFTPDSDLEAATIQLTNSGDTSVATDIEWVALYDGEYTAETLPKYQPKGYGAELLECQRYLQRFRTADLRKTYCDDFRPTMRETAEGIVSTFDQEIYGVTYYFASAEL